ncbi:MAG: AMP-binding protein, partial [Gammaproteobacteria bacterium]
MSTFTLYSQADRFPEENSADYPTFVTPDDRQTLLRHWNNTQRSFDHVCVQRLIERQVQRTPDAEAVRCGDKSVSYRELDRRANRLAHFLGRLGVVHETLVGVWLERSIDAIVAFLAVWKAGGACVPFDTESPRERLVMMLDDCRPLALITRNGIDAGILASSPCKVVQLERDADVIACESEENPLVVATLSDLAVVFYTSGTTGRPKGVMQVHRGIANWVVWQQRNFPLGSGDGELQTAPISFGLSVGQIFQALTAGARVVIIPPGVPLYGQTIVDTIRRYSCTKWVPVPSLLRIALAAGLTSCASLRYVLSTGSPL